MLHELLLALSGHSSPLFESRSLDTFPAISPAEKGLIKSVGHLASLHRALKAHLAKVVTDHPSLICRAVSQSILATHLSRFQQLILDKEREILCRDVAVVGAYDIVPLAGVLKSFDGWKRRLEWYWELGGLILPIDARIRKGKDLISKEPCTGVMLMESLRLSSHTGYPDIEDAAVSLQRVAEQVWVRHLSSWLLLGQLSDYAASDFFVKSADSQAHGIPEFLVENSLVPSFVTDEAASSILFVGKLLNFLKLQNVSSPRTVLHNRLSKRKHPLTMHRSDSMVPDVDQVHVLANIETPIKATLLEVAVTRLRRTLSNRLVDEILPTHELLQIIGTLKDFFLLDHLSFTDNLIGQADRYLKLRYQQLRIGKASELTDLAGVMMKQGELDAVLSHTWAATAQSLIYDDLVNDSHDWARERIHLKLTSNVSQADENLRESRADDANDSVRFGFHSFNDLLLSASAILTVDLDSSLSFFLTPSDLHIYSAMHSYLTAVRRGQIRLGTLWRQGQLRKAPPVQQRAIKAKLKNPSVHDKNGAANRAIFMRKIWACSSIVYFTLSELGVYLADEVVTGSWYSFHAWITTSTNPSSSSNASSSNESEQELGASSTPHNLLDGSKDRKQPSGGNDIHIKDVEDLASAHHRYLSILIKATLLHDESYVRCLRSLLGLVDQLVAFIERLQQAQHNLDMQIPSADNYLHEKYQREEDFLRNEALRTTKRLDETLEKLITRITQLSQDSVRYGEVMQGSNRTAFHPWDNRDSLGRLSMKLELSIGRKR